MTYRLKVTLDCVELPGLRVESGTGPIALEDIASGKFAEAYAGILVSMVDSIQDIAPVGSTLAEVLERMRAKGAEPMLGGARLETRRCECPACQAERAAEKPEPEVTIQ